MKFGKKILALGLMGVLALSVLTGCGSTGGTVSTDGSTSMEKVIGALKETFESENKSISVTYNPTGSGSGITAVAEGRNPWPARVRRRQGRGSEALPHRRR